MPHNLLLLSVGRTMMDDTPIIRLRDKQRWRGFLDVIEVPNQLTLSVLVAWLSPLGEDLEVGGSLSGLEEAAAMCDRATTSPGPRAASGSWERLSVTADKKTRTSALQCSCWQNWMSLGRILSARWQGSPANISISVSWDPEQRAQLHHAWSSDLQKLSDNKIILSC